MVGILDKLDDMKIPHTFILLACSMIWFVVFITKLLHLDLIEGMHIIMYLDLSWFKLHEDFSSEAVKVNHVNCYEGYTLISSFKDNPYDSSLFQTTVNKNKHQGSAKCIGLLT